MLVPGLVRIYVFEVRAAFRHGQVAPYTRQVYSKLMICEVVLTRRAQRQLKVVPQHVAAKLLEWVDAVETLGVDEVRKRPGWHDEPLRGQRRGQRSIRLSRAYRAIYIVLKTGQVEFLSVEEVSKHDY